MTTPLYVDLGYECRMFRGAPGTAPAIEVKELSNLRAPDARQKIDTTRRSSNGLRVYRTGLRDISVEFEIPWSRQDNGDASADLNAFCDAYDANDAIAIKVTDASNKYGIMGDFLVESRPMKQELGDAVVVTITLCPTDMYGRVPVEI